MTFTSYSQNFEDVVLWRALGDVNRGRYLDIGAQDPVIDSVSLAFYEAGWKGVHVEPVPAFAERLRKARPDEQVIEAAVTDTEGPIRFFELGGLSSGREDIAQHHAKIGNQSREILVPTVRLDRVLEKMGREIHWMKIDVEGMELDVLRSWGGNPIRPWVIVIESTFPNTQEPTHHLWIKEVEARGYREVHFDGLSRYFLHEEQDRLAERFSSPASVFDAFSITSAHFASGLLVEQANQSAREFELRQAELGAEISRLQEEGRRAAEKVEAERGAHAAAETHAQELSAALQFAQLAEATARSEADRARAERAAALEELALAERVKSTTLDRLWRDRHEAEGRLRERHAEAELKLRERHEALENELRASSNAQRDQLHAKQSELTDWRNRAEALGGEIRALKQQLADLQQAFSSAQNVIMSARRSRPGRWQRFGQSLGLAKRDNIRRILEQWESSSAPDHGALRNLNTVFKGATEASANESVEMSSFHSLDEIIALPAPQFIEAAYKLILGRDPDPEGRAYYSGRLNRGRSRLNVLSQLARSPEARDRGEEAELIRQAIRRRERASLPLFGSLFSNRQHALYDLRTEGSSQRSADIGHSSGHGPGVATVEQLGVLAEDLTKLKSIVHGMGFAIEGIAKAQARHEAELARLRPESKKVERSGKTPFQKQSETAARRSRLKS